MTPEEICEGFTVALDQQLPGRQKANLRASIVSTLRVVCGLEEAAPDVYQRTYRRAENLAAQGGAPPAPEPAPEAPETPPEAPETPDPDNAPPGGESE